jgi:hypothetical protein
MARQDRGRWIRQHITHSELFGYTMAEAEVVEKLSMMSVYDCLWVTSRISCIVESGSLSAEQQLETLRRLGLDKGFEKELAAVFASGAVRVLFFPQQLTHLARLAILHADDRPADDFDGGKLIPTYLRCLFGVTDLFDKDLVQTRVGLIEFVLRQAGTYHTPDLLYVSGRYYELLMKLWPTVIREQREFAVEEAFHRYTGMSLADYVTLGFGTFAHFMNFGTGETPEADFVLTPPSWLQNTQITEDRWRPFFDEVASTVGDLRAALRAEDLKYGPTTHRSVTFDRTPLVVFKPGVYIPVSFSSLVRKVTEGPYWILRTRAQEEGLRDEVFTGPFGRVFERFVQDSVVRIGRDAGSREGTVIPEFEYGTKRAPKRTSDVLIAYPEDVVLMEVVGGRMRASTVTRGNISGFNQDFDQLIKKKAKQLDRCIKDLRSGVLPIEGFTVRESTKLWPVLVTPEDFPLLPPTADEIERRLKRIGYLKGAGRLSVIDADDLAAIEALVARGFTVLELITGWRRGAPDLPFANYIDQLDDERLGQVGYSKWHEDSFERFTGYLADALFRGRPFPDAA